MLKRRTIALSSAIAVVALALIGWYASRDGAGPTPSEVEDYVFWQPKELTDFTLSVAGNKALGLADLKGKWSFVFFGYTHCPDVCPTSLAVLGQAFRALETSPAIAQETQGIFVSVDPARDTPESLRDYASYFNPRFIGATGDRGQVDAFARQIGATYAIHAPQTGKPGDNYLVTHTSTIFLVDPQGRLYGRFPSPHAAQEIADVFVKIRNFNRERGTRRWVFF